MRVGAVVRFVAALLVFASPVCFAQSDKAALSSAKPVTFARDIAPILQNHCQECHRPGQAAPMSLLTYKDARPWARSIATQVARGTMPPWHADPEHGEFLNDRRLNESDKQTIAKWVAAGAPEGNAADLPPQPILIDLNVQRDGGKVEQIPAVVQLSKQAFAYVFDRRNGRPVWPLEERPVRQTDVKGEWTAATQPFPSKPPAFDQQGVTVDDLIDFLRSL